MNPYHEEQLDALEIVEKHLENLPASELLKLKDSVTDYLKFRQEVDGFLYKHFSDLCTQTCYQSRLSACCSREGIITFFADVVINSLVSETSDLEGLKTVLSIPNAGFKCVYLSEEGCLWRLKPIVCQMYLCKRSKGQVFGESPRLQKDWELLEQKRKLFTWPDQPVLFDNLESYFLNAGYQSPLMYLHNSPGLLRVKLTAKKNITSKRKI